MAFSHRTRYVCRIVKDFRLVVDHCFRGVQMCSASDQAGFLSSLRKCASVGKDVEQASKDVPST